MPHKLFNISYYIDYTALPKYPNNIVLLGSGGGAPAGPTGIPPAAPADRMFLSYRRDITEKKGGKVIGEASYLINAYKVKLSSDRKSGNIWATYTANHEFKNKCGDDYDVRYEGNFKFKLGVRPGSDPAKTIDPSLPAYLYVVGNDVDNVSATSVFKNKKKISYGDCVTTFNNGNYNIKGRIGMYGTTA
jgi:hypothetical protein